MATLHAMGKLRAFDERSARSFGVFTPAAEWLHANDYAERKLWKSLDGTEEHWYWLTAEGKRVWDEHQARHA